MDPITICGVLHSIDMSLPKFSKGDYLILVKSDLPNKALLLQSTVKLTANSNKELYMELANFPDTDFVYISKVDKAKTDQYLATLKNKVLMQNRV